MADVANTVSVGSAANERRIVNVAAGTISATSTDAVNGGQLYALTTSANTTSTNLATTNQRLAAVFGGGSSVGADGVFTTPSYTVQGGTYNRIDQAFAALDTSLTNLAGVVDALSANAAYFKVNSTGPGSTASGADSVAIGTNAQASAAGAIAMGSNAAATGTNAIAIGSGATATGSVVSAPNTVSFGSAGNERRLTNVAAGVASTDAVNVSQLNSVASGFQSQISGVQSQITGLANTVDANDTRARRGIAATAAMTNPGMPSAPGKTAWALNTAFFAGETGVGFGVNHRLNTSIPLYISGGYANGGGLQHLGRVGLGGEF